MTITVGTLIGLGLMVFLLGVAAGTVAGVINSTADRTCPHCQRHPSEEVDTR